MDKALVGTDKIRKSITTFLAGITNEIQLFAGCNVKNFLHILQLSGKIANRLFAPTGKL